MSEITNLSETFHRVPIYLKIERIHDSIPVEQTYTFQETDHRVGFVASRYPMRFPVWHDKDIGIFVCMPYDVNRFYDVKYLLSHAFESAHGLFFERSS